MNYLLLKKQKSQHSFLCVIKMWGLNYTKLQYRQQKFCLSLMGDGQWWLMCISYVQHLQAYNPALCLVS